MGQLFYVIGASGVGKDSLLNYAREKINGDFPVLFAHRYITRPAHAGGENHVALSMEEFELRKRNGLLVMDWESHGNRYGIGREVDFWLSQNCGVVVNGSREYLPHALKRYPWMTTVLIKAKPETIYDRLTTRSRESLPEIEKRMARTNELNFSENSNIVVIQNDGLLETAGEEITAVLLAGIFTE